MAKWTDHILGAVRSAEIAIEREKRLSTGERNHLSEIISSTDLTTLTIILRSQYTKNILGNSLFFLNRVKKAFLLHHFIEIPFLLFQIALNFLKEKVECIREIRFSHIQPTHSTARHISKGAPGNFTDRHAP